MSEQIVISVYDDNMGVWGKIPLRRSVLNRAETVERMAKAMNKERYRFALREDVYLKEDKKELLRQAKAALDALLGGKNA